MESIQQVEGEAMNTQHMNDKLLTVEEAALAWAQGKVVEGSPIDAEIWAPVRQIGAPIKDTWNPNAFVEGIFKFRLAPEPPAKKLRPYTREELAKHLGRRIQGKSGMPIGVLCAVSFQGKGLVCGEWLSPDALAAEWEWVGGEPCGVEVEA